MSDSTEITELVALDATRVDGVGNPANGTPFLLLKAASDDDEKAKDYDGDGTADSDDEETEDKLESHAGGKLSDKAKEAFARNAQRVKDKANKSDSEEADNIEDEVTGEAAKDLSAEEREALPASKFAYVSPDGGKHLPVHDEGHVRAALGRFNQTDFSGAEDPGKAKAAAASKIKSAAAEHGINIDDDSAVAQAAAKKGAVQEALHGTDTPEESGKQITSTSGVAGPVTAGVIPEARDTETASGLPGVTGPVQGGESSYRIPAESKVDGNAVKHAAITFATASIADFIERLAEQREQPDVVKGDAASTDPGSAPWESLDSVTLQQVAQTLAHCGAAIDAIQKRECIEAASGDPSDWFDSWDLMTATDALDCALGIAARLAFVEQASAQAAKSGIDFERLDTARDSLTRTLSAGEQHITKAREGSTTSEEDVMAVEVTKEELAEAIDAGVEVALKERIEQIVAEALKNANNGGDIDAADIKANGQVDEHLQGVPDGGKVDSQFVNKEIAEQLGNLVKALEESRTETSGLKELVVKMGRKARPGGPILDGQIRPDLARQEVAKSADPEMEQLRKEFAEAKDPIAKQQIGEALTLAALRQESGARFGTGSPLG